MTNVTRRAILTSTVAAGAAGALLGELSNAAAQEAKQAEVAADKK